MSDHKTLLADVEVNQKDPNTNPLVASNNNARSFHHFNWRNESFVAEYKVQIKHSMAQILRNKEN